MATKQRTRTLNFENAVQQAAALQDLCNKWLNWRDPSNWNVSIHRLRDLLEEARALKKELRTFGYNALYVGWLLAAEQLANMIFMLASSAIYHYSSPSHKLAVQKGMVWVHAYNLQEVFCGHPKYREVARQANSRFPDLLSTPFPLEATPNSGKGILLIKRLVPQKY